MTPALKQLNKFVVNFLNENEDAANLEELWLDSATQKQIKSLLSRVNRPPKDPNAPKRGKSSYLYFCQDNRAQVKKSLGKDAKATDVTRQLGVLWNKLKNDKKKAKKLNEYVKLAEADKVRYQKEKDAYTPSHNISSQVVKKQGPKRAKSAYIYFCSDNRATVKKDLGKDAKATDVTRELGVRWNTLKSEGGTAKYDKLAKKDRQRYQKEKESLQNTDSSEHELVEEAPKKAPKKKVKKVSPKKTSRKTTGYQVFCNENRPQYKKDNPNARAAEITKKLSSAWKALSKNDKASYK